jgi:alpha-ketoglutaric semialdehyde dehydrogenase
MSDLTGHNYIGGRRSAAGTVRLRSLDASTGEPLPLQFAQATPDEVHAAASAAAAAFPAYRGLPAERRAQFLDAIADELDALDDRFVATVCRETALPTARIQGERGRTSGQMRLFATVLRRGDCHGARIDRALPQRTPMPRVDLRQLRIGIGPVAVFGASAAERTGMPAGVFNMVYGSGVGEWLVKHPAIQAVGFTGSLRGGRALCEMAAARPQPIPVFAEMSSINPVVLLPGALQARGAQVAQDLAASVVLGAGQFCTNPGLVIGLRSPEFDAFVERFCQRMADVAPQTMLNAGGLDSYAHGLSALLAHPGVTRLVPSAGPGLQGRREPAAGRRRAAAGRGVRPRHRAGRGGRPGRAAAGAAGPARPADGHADW